jgi:glycosyltransferase involved in cell wall biosynthesis
MRTGETRRPHVLVIVENLPFCEDQRVRKQIPVLLAAGYHVSVITRRDPGNAAYVGVAGLTVLEHPSQPEPSGAAGYLREYALAFWWAALRSAAVRLHSRIDVVQLCQPPDIYFPLAEVLRRTGATIVVDQRDLMPELFTARYGEQHRAIPAVLDRLERRTQRAARYTIVVNQYLRNRMIGAGGVPDRVIVVRNGPRWENVRAARPDPDVRQGHPYLCCWAGKMAQQDRVDLLVEAIAHYVHAQGRHDCRFLLIGDGECLPALRAQVTQLGLDPWVGFPGWVQEPELYSCLAAADVGLDTSLQAEVSPVKAMEYMGFGLPVVAFDVGETATLVRDCAVLVRPGDAEQFAGELAALLDDAPRRTALGRAGTRRVAEELCWERQAQTYLSVIDSAAGRQAPRAMAEWSVSGPTVDTARPVAGLGNGVIR